MTLTGGMGKADRCRRGFGDDAETTVRAAFGGTRPRGAWRLGLNWRMAVAQGAGGGGQCPGGMAQKNVLEQTGRRVWLLGGPVTDTPGPSCGIRLLQM